jgi:hypothetical protein
MEQIHPIIDTLSLQNKFSIEQLKEGVSAWPKNLNQCLNRAALFRSLQARAKGDEPNLDKITILTHTLEPLLREATPTESEGYAQVHFQGTPWSSLNSIPFALVIVSVYKSYIVPAFGIILPLLTWILPYILLRVMYNIPIPFTEYTQILWRMWNGQPMPRTPEELFNPPPLPPEDALTQLRRMAQNAWTLFTLGQTMWQPIQQGRHFIRLDTECLSLGKSIVEVKETALGIYRTWSSYLPKWLKSWILECSSDARQAFAFVLENPFWLPHIFRSIGRFEVMYRLASRSDVVPTEFINSEEPILMIQKFGDPSIPFDSRIVSSTALGGKSQYHAIVTGPNRGGKSSFMRGVLLSVLLSHSFGCAFAEKAQMTHFTWIADGLRLDDKPGKQSMFEREVAFASSILNTKGGKGIILYDEIFHSTNPPDAIRASDIFCKSLWKKKNCISFVSTHVYSLAESAPPSLVKPLCLAAWNNGRFDFSYTVQKGICRVSSVDLVLQQYGLAKQKDAASLDPASF